MSYEELAEMYNELVDEGMSPSQAAALVDGVMREEMKVQMKGDDDGSE